MSLQALAQNTLPKRAYQKEITHPTGDTEAIISSLIAADAKFAADTANFAAQLRQRYGNTDTRQMLRDLWSFLRYNIQYKEDGDRQQRIQSPAALWRSKKGDCKSLSLFAGTTLRNLGIPYSYRFTAYEPKAQEATHVYVIAHTPNGDIILDAVWHLFDSEKKPTYQEDIPMTEISHIHGTNTIIAINDHTAFVANIYAELAQELARLPQYSRYAPRVWNKYKNTLEYGAKPSEDSSANIGFIIPIIAYFALKDEVKDKIKEAVFKHPEWFLYLFFKESIVASLPDKVKYKRERQEFLGKVIAKVLGIDFQEHFKAILRAGFLKKYNKVPEAALKEMFAVAAINGVGEVATAVATIGATLTAIYGVITLLCKTNVIKDNNVCGLTAEELRAAAPDANDFGSCYMGPDGLVDCAGNTTGMTPQQYQEYLDEVGTPQGGGLPNEQSNMQNLLLYGGIGLLALSLLSGGGKKKKNKKD